MDPSILKVVHIVAVTLLFFAFGGIAIGAGQLKANLPFTAKRTMIILHGVALVLILLTGFAQVHTLHTGFAPWVLVKIVVWLLLGGALSLLLRKPEWSRWTWLLVFVLATVAVTAAITHFGV